ncbi:TetR/AcrR family transcriptional regulator [Pantoea sp. B65]|uniref:TetR/AcrR family transcriptional regulator n=1 Tax=Pantoea sp. B65 TaxID=2813359 RepID=UPI0039B43364
MSEKKDTIIKSATELFNKEGFQSVGVDKIAAAAGVSKLTLYRNFPSKERLIIEVLHQRKEDFINHIRLITENQQTRRDKLFSFFNYYHDWFKHEDFRGCLLTHSLAEFGNKSKAIIEINRSMKNSLIQILLTILYPVVKGERAYRIAYTFIILVDGSVTAELTWCRHNEYSPALIAWSTAKILLESECIHL